MSFLTRDTLNQFCLSAAKWAMFAALLVIFGWLINLSLYAVPAFDDFFYGNVTRTRGLFGGLWAEYVRWNGRFMATFLILVTTPNAAFLTQYYYIVPLSIIAATLYSCRQLMLSMGLENLLFSFAFAVFLITSYSLQESVFWLSGGLTYGLGNALFIWLLAEYCTIFFGTKKSASTYITCLFAFLLSGFNETIMVVHLMVLVPFVIFSYLNRNRPAARSFILFFVCASIGALIVYLSPGNTYRASFLGKRNLYAAIENSFRFLTHDRQYPSYLYYSSGLILSCLLLFNPIPKFAIRTKYVIMACAYILVMLFAGIFVRYYFANYNPARAFAVDYILLMIMATLLSVWLYNFDPKFSARNQILAVAISIAIFTVAIQKRPTLNMDPGSMIFKLNMARENKRYNDFRFAILRQYPQNSYVSFPDYPNKTWAITQFTDITNNPVHHINLAFASYFGMSGVRVFPIGNNR